MGAGQKAAVELRNMGSTEYTYEYYKNGVKETATETLYVHAGTQSFYMDETPDGLDLNDETYKVTFDSKETNYTLADMYDEDGKVYGHQSILGGYVGAYAPAMNTHRSPFGGRNFEYYSEDGFIAGKIGAQVVSGLQDDGVMVYIKHFVLNDGDTNRNGVLTWASEQAIREIYCKPYEIAVKEGHALGIMACLNRIGMSWGHYGLFHNILRKEWGFQGYLITDGVGPGFTDLYNPPSLCLASEVAMLTRDDRVDEDTYTVVEGTGATDTLYGQYMLRESMHRLFYQMVATGNEAGAESAATNAVSSDNDAWKIAWAAIDIVVVALIVLLYIFGVHKQFTLPMLAKCRKKGE